MVDVSSVSTTVTEVSKFALYIKNNLSNFYSSGSMVELTKLTRVEPLTIVSKDCLNIECISDVNNVLLNMFVGYYLQSVATLTSIKDAEVIKLLDKLNPDRDSTGFFMTAGSKQNVATLSLENYEYSLPTNKTVALEAKDQIETLNDVSNLSVGKMVNVTIDFEKNTRDPNDTEKSCVTLPINFRLMVSAISNGDITKILGLHKEDLSFKERYHAWRAGRISFIKDLIFSQDLIDEHRRMMVRDESGSALEIMRRVNNAKKYGILTQNPSLATASNLFVITEEVGKEIETSLGGRLTNFRIREKAFQNTYAMIIVVIDREWQRVTFYTRGIESFADFSYKELKTAGKDKGPDIMDILKSMMSGHSPAF